MKITIAREKFLEGLQIVQSVVSSRTTLPILSNVLIQASDGGIALSTTDLDTGIRTRAEAHVDKPGGITLPARKLFSIVRELPTTDILLEADAKNNTTIKAGKSFFRIMGLSAEEFPPFPKTDSAKSFKLPQGALRDMLRQVSYAMSTDESRYVLNGVLMSFKDAKMILVATDGRRLALVHHEMDYPKANEAEAILPGKAVNELLRILGDQGDVEISLGENQAAFTLGTTFLVSKLIEGNYPNYKQVIPQETKERLVLEREPFLSTVKRVALLSSEKSNSIRMTLKNNEVEISANSPDVGEARESLPVQYKGKEFSIAFNPEYLGDPLRALSSPEVFIDFTDELSPGVVRYNGPFLYVIMPMRTNT
jgi:DNA polymerase III subunit beta